MVPPAANQRSSVAAVQRRVRRHLGRLGLPAGSGIVVAVSGGPDSSVLLDALASVAPEFKIVLSVAHFHHGLRGDTADRDQAFVERLAERYKLPVHVGRGDAGGLALDEGLSVEDAARRLRRRFLEEVCVRTGCGRIALGQTRDDQAETLLLNLLRGAGPRGLGGMPEAGPGRIIRPLIGVSRAEVMACLEEAGLEHCEDETNLDTRFARSRVRRELIPLLEARFNPRVREVLSRQSGLFREVDRFLTRLGKALLEDPEVAECGPNHVLLRITRLLEEPAVLRRAVLRAAIRQAGGSLDGVFRTHIEALLRLLKAPGSGRVDLPLGIRASRSGDLLEIRGAGGTAPEVVVEPPEPLRIPIRHGGEIAWPPGGFIRATLLTVPQGALVPLKASRRSAWFDLDQLPDTLVLRTPRPGDRIELLGGGGTKKLSDVFVDLKVPRGRRRLQPVLTLGLEPGDPILWVVGAARSSVAAVRPQSRSLLQLEWFGDWK